TSTAAASLRASPATEKLNPAAAASAARNVSSVNATASRRMTAILASASAAGRTGMAYRFFRVPFSCSVQNSSAARRPARKGTINGTPIQESRIRLAVSKAPSTPPPLLPDSSTTGTGNRQAAKASSHRTRRRLSLQNSQRISSTKAHTPCHPFEVVLQRVLAAVQFGQGDALFLQGLRQPGGVGPQVVDAER